MLVTFFFIALFVVSTASITPVPGTIYVQLLSNNQVSNGTYRPTSLVHYTVRLENIPIDDNVQIGVEIRGSNPAGGPRGYITTARSTTTTKQFVKEAVNGLQFKLVPTEIYAGYSWFLRPFVYFADELVSTNMMNSGASEMFIVLKN